MEFRDQASPNSHTFHSFEKLSHEIQMKNYQMTYSHATHNQQIADKPVYMKSCRTTLGHLK